MKPTRLPNGLIVRDTYTIVRYLGSGAFGDVYLARHRYMGLQAMKVLSLTPGTDPLDEAFILTRVGHPNIIRVFEANEFSWEGSTCQYFSMEYIDGGTLAKYLESTRPEISARLNLSIQIARGLAVAHSQDPPIVHRDLTPWNILVASDQGRPVAKITDFGLAKQVDLRTKLASAAGNLFYMPPEAFWGYESPSSDVYSAGVIIFEMITGRTPFPVEVPSSATQEQTAALIRASRHNAVPRASKIIPDLDPRWDQFFEKALAFDADKRLPSAIELELELDQLRQFRHPPTNSGRGDVQQMVHDALEASKQAISLNKAIELLEKACQLDESIREQYAPLVELWKRGVVQ